MKVPWSTMSSGAHNRVRCFGALNAALVVLFFTVFVPAPAHAQTPPSGSVRLIDQTSWVTAGAAFDMNLAVATSTPEQLDVVVTVYSALPNRSQYAQSLNDQISGSSVLLERYALNDVLSPENKVHIQLPVGDSSQRRYYLRSAGVYPVRVDLRAAGSDEIVDRFVTHLINQPTSTPMTKLGVLSMLSVASPASSDRTDPFDVTDEGTGVEAMADALTSHPTMPVGLVAQPETVDRLAATEPETATNNALKSLEGALANRPVLNTSYAPVPDAMFLDELGPELDHQLSTGQATLRAAFPNVDNTTWASSAPLSQTALAKLEARGVKRVILPDSSFKALTRDTALARPFTVSINKKSTIPAIQADSGLTDHFRNGAGALEAHQLLADLAVLWNDRPGQQRLVVAMPPASWVPTTEFLNAYFDGMTNSPLLTAASIDSAFSTQPETSGKSTLNRQAVNTKVDSSGFPTERIRKLRERVSAYDGVVSDAPKISASMQQRLLIAESAGLTTNERNQALDGLDRALNEEIGGLTMPSERSIRLTARTGEIPVSIQNDTGHTLKVIVVLASDKLRFPNGNRREVTVEREYMPERFAVDARTSGSFPVQVRLESPDGSLILQRSELTVRSTATSAMGLVLSSGAGAILVLWWLRSSFKGRKKRIQSERSTSPAVDATADVNTDSADKKSGETTS